MKAIFALSLLLGACGGTESNRGTDAIAPDGGDPTSVPEASTPEVNPEYTAAGQLLRPAGWETWVFLGSALNLSYSATEPPPTDILSVVYMEPTAFRHFQETGEFREGTQTVLTAYATATGVPPAVDGVSPTDRVAFEMSVKDRSQHPEGWGYYDFGSGPLGTARPRAQCFDCHDQHAETDHVFTQFYPMLP